LCSISTGPEQQQQYYLQSVLTKMVTSFYNKYSVLNKKSQVVEFIFNFSAASGARRIYHKRLQSVW